VLEDRTVPSGYQHTNLVAYQPGLGHFTDPNLNGWGMTSMPDRTFCVANTFTTGLATFYDRSGHVLPRTITVPWSPAGSAALGLPAVGHPTGVVSNDTSDFVISANGKSAPARLIFDSIDGTISGWNPDVDATKAILIRDAWANNGPGAVYTGLDMGQDSHGQNVLYATDFLPNHNRVEMINGGFHTIGSFTDAKVTSIDPNLGAWSVEALNGRLYVTFADLSNPDGAGVVDVFDTDGNQPPVRFAANAPGEGPLQNPWGIAQAPAKFGAYSNDLLIGNVAGAGNINVFDPDTGAYLGQLRQPNGAPIAIKGLWDLEFGESTPHGAKINQLFFDAGPNTPGDSTGGLFGVIRASGKQGGNGRDHPVGEAPPLPGMYLTVKGSVSVGLSSDSVGLSSSPPRFASQAIEAPSPRSRAMTMVPLGDLRRMLRAPRASHLEMMDPQLPAPISTLDADPDALGTMMVLM
jgi:uncharacterized protein (TIGR03118 family)